MIKTWVKDPEPIPKAALPPTSAQVPIKVQVVAQATPAAPVQVEEGISPIFGKATLANKLPTLAETGRL